MSPPPQFHSVYWLLKQDGHDAGASLHHPKGWCTLSLSHAYGRAQGGIVPP